MSKSKKDIELEKFAKELDAKYSFYKFFLGSFLLGFITIVVNFQIHVTQIELKEKEFQAEYVSKFITQALDTDGEKRLRFAHYFYRMLGENWNKYYEDTYKEVKSQKIQLVNKAEKIAETKLEVEKISVDTASNSPTMELLSEKVVELEKLQLEKKELERQILPKSVVDFSSIEVFYTGWIYLGKKNDKNKWLEKTFQGKQDLKVGNVILLDVKTFLRNNKPVKIISSSDFTLGNRITVLNPGTKLHLLEIWENPENKAVWSRVEVF